MRNSLESFIIAFFSQIAKIRREKPRLGLWLIPLAPFLILSALFARLASWRFALYERGGLPSAQVKAFVISVGNLTSGGSGKTPFVQYLVKTLEMSEMAILSRGYGSRFFQRAICISDPLGPLFSAALSGDEPNLLARQTRIPIIVDKNRLRGARFALKHFKARALILDDGFQHRQLKRQRDVVLIDQADIDPEPLCFPAGPQRNRLKDCNLADLVIITGCDHQEQWRQKAALVAKVTKAGIVGALYELSALSPFSHWNLQSDLFEDHPLSFDKGPIFVCCAIANPHRFHKTLLRAGFSIVGHDHLPDHAPFDQKRAARAFERAKQLGAQAVVCTEKDAVKWSAEVSLLPFYVARSAWRITEGTTVLHRFFQSVKRQIAENF